MPTQSHYLTVDSIELACLAKLDEVMQKLAGSISEPEMARLARTLRKVVIASLRLETVTALSALLTIARADIADLRDLRLIAVALADRLEGMAGINLKALAQVLADVLDRAEIAMARPVTAATRIGAPAHG